MKHVAAVLLLALGGKEISKKINLINTIINFI